MPSCLFVCLKQMSWIVNTAKVIALNLPLNKNSFMHCRYMYHVLLELIFWIIFTKFEILMLIPEHIPDVGGKIAGGTFVQSGILKRS